ncbi:UBLE1A [Acanthosepion pharaonis]|uniref:SUMO-activating enzyme subunit 1 n=1 Tax=Acanthosepion pharaonis TaxID=158019 RepID=A0A812DBD0_ACAPH|nr:UBLE1A [Sepia pharaonis]
MVEQHNITEDEAALYDRQIRLWGLDAQKRLRAAKVLLVGLRGLGAEVAKNIVLAGINSLVLLDHTKVTDEDRCSQFLVSREDVGKNEATQKLNPMVQITVDTEDVATKPDDFFYSFNVICVTCSTQTVLDRINKICHNKNIQFFAGDVFGYFGYMFSDLGKHEYAEEVPKPKAKETDDNENGEPKAKQAKKEVLETIVVKKITEFVRFDAALHFDWTTEENKKRLKRTPKTYFIMQVLFKFMEKHKRRPDPEQKSEDQKELENLKVEVIDALKVDQEFLSDYFVTHCFAELGPVSAIVGGVLGQEIIKAVSQKDKPHNNFFFFDGVNGSGLVDQIGA